MAYPLARMVKREGKTRRKSITLRAIFPTQSLASDLAAITTQVPKGWQAQAPAILDAYEKALSSLTTDALVKDAGEPIDDALVTAEAEMNRLVLTLVPQLRDWTIKVERWHRKKFIAAVLSPTGVNLSTILNPAGETMDAFRQGILALIRSIDDDTRNRIASAVWRGFQERTPRREVAKEIAEATDIGRKRALRIASDQTVKMSARLDQARQEEAGIDAYEWLHSGKKRPRPVHVARNGSIYRWAKPPADGHPGTLPNCGCKARAHLMLEG